MAQGMVDPAIFEHLQSKIDDDKIFRDVCLVSNLSRVVVANYYDCRASATSYKSSRSKVATTDLETYEFVGLIEMVSSDHTIDTVSRPFHALCEEYVLQQTSDPRTSLTPTASSVVNAAEAELQDEFKTIRALAEKASKQPYYKWNSMWTRTIQDVVCSIGRG
jgi:hypothetical protein